MPPLIVEAFRGRRQRLGAAPVLTYYDLTSGERTELSALSLGNWVDKTSNLLVDELLIEPGDGVELELAREHPGHWVTFIWELACWQVGAAVTLGAASEARVRVVPPAGTWSTSTDSPVVVCSLHPLGLGLPEPPPSGALDYTVEVRTQGDQYSAVPLPPHLLAWWEPAGDQHDGDSGPGSHPPERRLSQAQLTERPVGKARRILIQPATAWGAVDALVDTILAGGSLVVVAGRADGERVRRIAEQERVEA